MNFRLVPKSVTLNSVVDVTLRYFITASARIEVIDNVYDVVVKKSSRSLSHLLMSFLLSIWSKVIWRITYGSGNYDSVTLSPRKHSMSDWCRTYTVKAVHVVEILTAQSIISSSSTTESFDTVYATD